MSKTTSKKTSTKKKAPAKKKPQSAGKSVVVDDKATATQKPLASAEPPAAKQPSAGKEPSAAKQASAAKQTSASEKPLASKKPSTDSKEKSVVKESAVTKSSQSKTVTETPSDAKQQAKQSKSLAKNEESNTSKKTSEKGKPPVETVQKKSGSALSVVAILISLLAIGATGYSWYKIQVLSAGSNAELALGMSNIQGSVGRISDSVTRLQTAQTGAVTQPQLETQLLKAQVGVDKQLGLLKRDQKELSESVLKISTDLQKGANEYVVDEISQLLKLANNNVIFSNDIDAAIKAFTLADTQLKELASPRFSEVRRTINKEIALLRSIEQVDIESTLAKLSVISDNVSSFKLENEPPVLDEAAGKGAAEANGEKVYTWRTELKQAWSDILDTVKIQKVGKAPKPLLAPTERYFLDQNLQLTLNKAEIALLQGRQKVYVDSVAQAHQWMSDYFDLKDKDVKDAMSQLNKLKGVTLEAEIPSVAGSYDLLQSIKGGQ